MSKFFKEFYYEEDGMGVIEIVMIIAVLIGLALLFRKQLADFATKLMGKVFNENVAPDPETFGEETTK